MKLWILLLLLSESHTDGSDPIRRYTPADYNAAFQNFGMVQDADGRLFSANTAGVLMFDGARWELYPLPENQLVRSIGIDSTGRIWVGAERSIGHLEPDLDNGFRFVTDLDSIRGETWVIRSTADATWFQASDEIVSWKDGRFNRMPIRTGAQKAMWNIDGKILVHEFGVGWFYMDQGRSSPVSELNRFNSIRVVAFISEPGGSWIISTRTNGVYRMEADLTTIRKVDLQIPETTSARRLNDGSIAIGTVRNGMFLLTPDLDVITHPGQEIGLHLDAVWAMMEDREGHVWMGTDRGLVQMYRYPDFDSWDSRSGLVGNIQAIRRFRGQLVIGTSVGLFLQTDNGFDPIEEVDQAVWDFLVQDNVLWIATGEGLKRWDGSTLQSVGPKTPIFSLFQDIRDPETVWIGHAGGLSTYRIDGRWMSVSGVSQDVRNMTQSVDGTVWAGTSRGGVVRVAPDLTVTLHLPSVAETRVAMFDGVVLAGTTDGIRRWDDRQGMFIPWESSSSSGVYRMIADSQESIWVVRSKNSSAWLEKITRGKTIKEPFLRLPNRGLIRLFSEPGVIWVGTTSGLYRIDQSRPPHRPVSYRVVAHSVQAASNTRIRFAAPWFEDPESIRYRYRLIDETDWTDWSKDSEAQFVGLWEGRYAFEAEATNKYGEVVRMNPIEFTISPPWFRTRWVYGGMAIAVVLGIWGTVFVTQEYNRIRTIRLEKLVRDRTKQVQRQKEELLRSNQSLTRLIDQKNTILGIAAHDLKNPLASIQGFAELLVYSVNDEADLNAVRADLAEQLGYISEASYDMLRIIRDLIEISVTQKGDLVMNPKPFPLTDMMYTVTNSYRTVARKKQIQLVADLPSESMVVFADADRIQEVILNLVSNAVKYTRIGGTVTVFLDRETRNEVDWVGVRIRDQGPGFTEEDRSKMYGLFTRLSAVPTADERSNGIGLYIVKEFTERNGGRLELTTSVGQGSEFTVWLPIAQP